MTPDAAPDPTPDQESESESSEKLDPVDRPRRLLVLGANGPTGRRTVRQALSRGYEVEALTRHPESFPIEDERLQVISGDATDPSVIDAAVATTDVVICTIGAAFTRRPVEVYSVTAALVIAAMHRHGRRRILVVTSSGVHSSHLQQGLVQTLSYTVMRRLIGRTVYDDMVRMERLISASGLDWTIVRPPGLSNEPGTGYAVAENGIEGGFCSREDLAAMLLDQLDDDRFVQKIAAVATPHLRVGGMQMLRQEVLKR